MCKKRFSESQIIGIIKEYESDISAPELARKYGIGESTVYAWHSKYSGMSERSRAETVKAAGRRKPAFKTDVCYVEYGS